MPSTDDSGLMAGFQLDPSSCLGFTKAILDPCFGLCKGFPLQWFANSREEGREDGPSACNGY